MNAVLNFEYVTHYLHWFELQSKEWQDKNIKAKQLLLVIISEVTKPTTFPGHPRYNRNYFNTMKYKQLLFDDMTKPDGYNLRTLYDNSGFPYLPGISDTTWCIYPVNFINQRLGKDTLLITDNGKISNTGGNEMAELFFRGAATGLIKELSSDEAQIEANNGEPVTIASTGLYYKLGGKQVRNSGHVATLAPSTDKARLWCGQAGAKNGFFPVQEIFCKKNLVTEPRYFLLPQRG